MCVTMNCKISIILLFCVGYSQATFRIFGKDSLASKTADLFGLNNIFSVDADARAKLFNNEIGIDGAVGVSKDEAGAHAGGNADVLGQKLNIHGDLLNGHEISQRVHQVYRDDNGRQYVLQPDYIGSKKVYRRKYLDDGVYLDRQNKNGNNGAGRPVDKSSDSYILINDDEERIPSRDTVSKLHITENNRIPQEPVDDDSVVIRGDDDTEYWVQGNNGKLIRVSKNEAVPQQQQQHNEEYSYY